MYSEERVISVEDGYSHPPQLTYKQVDYDE
jgi:hypothetical protein